MLFLVMYYYPNCHVLDVVVFLNAEIACNCNFVFIFVLMYIYYNWFENIRLDRIMFMSPHNCRRIIRYHVCLVQILIDCIFLIKLIVNSDMSARGLHFIMACVYRRQMILQIYIVVHEVQLKLISSVRNDSKSFVWIVIDYMDGV